MLCSTTLDEDTKLDETLWPDRESRAEAHFQADIRDPDHYHLVINTALINPETIVQMIKAMIQDAQAPN